MNQPLHLKAYAKINLALDVVRRRDDGYHDVRMIMQTVRLFDRISLKRTRGRNIRVSTNLSYLPSNEDNLVYKAIDIIRKKHGIKDGVEAFIDKHIPVAAGLAGGSTDAAAALVGMNQLFSLGISQSKLIEYGASFGADIPFCIMRGTALSEGIGEILTPLPPIPNCWILLIKPTFSMSTKYVYQNLQLNNNTVHPDIDKMIEAIKIGSLPKIAARMGNVLESAVGNRTHSIAALKAAIEEQGAEASLMSGSGSTIFGLFQDKDLADRALSVLSQDPLVHHGIVVSPFQKSHGVNLEE